MARFSGRGGDGLKVFVPTAAGRREITRLLTGYTWSGSIKRCAREFAFDMAASELDADLPRVDCPMGTAVSVEDGAGRAVFEGMVVYRKRTGGGAAISHRCLDEGRRLSACQGWYNWHGAPEAAVRQICADFGFTPGRIAATGAAVSRKFTGVACQKIINTLYTKAAETTGRRYVIRVEGKALSVLEKPVESDCILAPRQTIMHSSIAESIEKLVDSVAVYDEYGNKLRVVRDDDAVALYGLMERAVTQRRGADAAAEAGELLEDNGPAQTVTVECLGDLDLISGEAVVVRETSAGAAGLFWIDSDRHQWKNGQYVAKLDLNFRNLMDETNAGKEK
ncbi:XkdQ/YqbQ family protein [Lawsonibacter faecis]|uniref:YqbQ/XkdQ domain-containing protein n=1 Tax=Lawsonibacter faecis TaxID=2763052 RepID=A0A8J6J4L5_9FIRM|nr:hypothetical protein [Lawsonibacter faecis]MBC5736072.1 hypothetical protein [Lawsonibacter faecis]